MTTPALLPDLSVVALGGGHGLAAALRAVRRLTSDVSAVVSVADNGGSTGRLRQSRVQPAPGDLRKCLVALSDPQSVLARTMEYRFSDGELEGHALGNLLLSAMAEVCGSLPDALGVLGELLGIEGRVLSATTGPVDLVARTTGGDEVIGQVAVMGTADIESVWLNPPEATVDEVVLDLIERADVLLLGPGSLYTSVLAAACHPDIVASVAKSAAPLVYLCNLHPQPFETEGYGVDDHVAALRRHHLEPDVVLFDPREISGPATLARTVSADLTDPATRAHDPVRLAAVLHAVLTDLGISGQ